VTPASLRRQRGMTLIELLVAMTIMAFLTTMIIGTWISLTKAYSFTSRSDRQRDFANQAIARMAREIRDAQQVPGSTSAAFVRAYPDEVRLYSTFNMAGNSDPTSTPRLTRFILRETDPVQHVGTIYREFPGADGLFDTGDDVSSALVKDVVNLRQTTDLFIYSAINATTGQMYQSSGMTTLVPAARIQTVRILLLVDLNPGKSPNYMDISTTVEPRNVRHL
jgi:prepilin-type N-terminal cleavage/methylation domain-containing protein